MRIVCGLRPYDFSREYKTTQKVMVINMREFIATVIVFAVFMTLIPCLVFLSGSRKADKDKSSQETSVESVEIYFTDEKESKNYTADEYVIGAVLAQMPADFNEEALKAQCVLANTYACYRRNAEKFCPTENLHGAIMSDNESLYQGFFTETQAKSFYGDDYETAYDKIKSACEQVSGVTLTYENSPVIVAFHAISSGNTVSAKDAWGQDIPYLQAIESLSDKDIDGIESKATVTEEQLKNALLENYPEIDFSSFDDAEKWVLLSDVTDTGYVKTVSVCGTEISASDFTNLFDISSPCFTVEYNDKGFTFTAMGYGHLVGLSQYGANAMADNGRDYKEILMHYYTDCEISLPK